MMCSLGYPYCFIAKITNITGIIPVLFLLTTDSTKITPSFPVSTYSPGITWCNVPFSCSVNADFAVPEIVVCRRSSILSR